MAGDWIAMRHDLAETAEVLGLATALGIDRDAVVGKLHRIWSWFDRQTTDGHARSVTSVTLTSHLDRVADVTGFAEAMQKVGWLVVEGASVVLPNFERWNGKTAKTRLLATRRKQKERASDVTLASRPERDKNATTGQDSTGQDKEDKTFGASKRAALVERFEKFWERYPRREGKRGPKGPALTKWLSLPERDREAAEGGLVAYAAACDGLPVDCVRYLRHRRWEDEVDESAPRGVRGPSPAEQALALMRREDAEREERRRNACP